MDEFDVMMVVLRFNERINARDLEGRGPVVAAVDALVGGGPPVLVDCVGDLFDDLVEGCSGWG